MSTKHQWSETPEQPPAREAAPSPFRLLGLIVAAIVIGMALYQLLHLMFG